MSDLYYKIHNDFKISIKDISHDLDISDTKWNFLFKYLMISTESIYFKGLRLYYDDEKLDQTIDYLSEETLIDEGKNHFKLLFRIKPLDVIYNRNMLSKLWWYYEYPSLVFLMNRASEDDMIDIFRKTVYHDDLIESINDITIIYRDLEQNVLWIKSDQNITQLSKEN